MLCIIIMEHIWKKAYQYLHFILSYRQIFIIRHYQNGGILFHILVELIQDISSSFFHCTISQYMKQWGWCSSVVETKLTLVRDDDVDKKSWKEKKFKLKNIYDFTSFNSTMRATLLPDGTTTILCCYTDNLSWAFLLHSSEHNMNLY